MRWAVIAIAALFASGAQAADDKATCILESAQYLPRIPDIHIEKSTAEAKPGNNSIRSMFLVQLKVRAAGQRTTYSYWCGVGIDGRPVVVRAGQ